MTESRTGAFIKNSAATAFYQIIVMASGFILPRLIISSYGSELNGLVNSLTQFITYFNLVESGIAGAGVFALYLPLSEKNHHKISGIVSAVKKYYIQAGFIFTFAVLILAVLYPLFIKANAISPLNMGFLTIILGAKGFMEFFTLAKYRVLLTADQKTFIISLSSAGYLILSTALTACLALLKFNIVAVYLIASFSLLFRSVFLHFYTKKNYADINFKSQPNTKALDKRWSALILQILGSLQLGAPVIIATIITDLKTVSVYSVYNMLMLGVSGVLSIFTGSLSSAFGDIIAKNDLPKLQKAYRDFELSYLMIITVIFSVSFIVIVPIVLIYTSGINDADYNVPLTGFLFVLNALLNNIKVPHGMMVISAGLYKETMLQSSLQGLILIIGGSVLGIFFGLNGILAGSCLSHLFRVIELMFFIPKHVTKLPVKDSLIRDARLILSVFVIYLPFIFLQIHIQSLKELIVLFSVSLVYAIFITLISALLFERQSINNILNRFKSVILHG